MKTFIDLCLIVMLAMIIFTLEGWWGLWALMPFALLCARIDVKPVNKKPVPTAAEEPLYYIVVDKFGTESTITCRCPVQRYGDWVEFTDEITEFGYHAHASFHAPTSVKIRE